MPDIKIINEISSHHIIVYLCLMGCILKVASTIVVFESSIHFFLEDAKEESKDEHWYR